MERETILTQNRSREYLEYAMLFKPEEVILRNQLMQWLPEEIIDTHSHSNLPKHVSALDPNILRHMMSTFPYFSLEESYSTKETFFPGKKTQSLRFPNAFRGIDHRAANDYLLDNSPSQDRVGLYGIPTDIPYTTQMLRRPNVSALKMYPAFFNPPAQEIYDYFKPEILEEAQALGVPIILHLPRMITGCVDDLQRVIEDFPRLRIVLAHLGLPHLVVPGLQEVYEKFSGNDNLFMDTAMIPSPEVVSMGIDTFGIDKIMFGSDEPLNLVRATVYNNPRLGQRLITEKDYHWVDGKEHEEYQELAKGVVHMHWQSLLALKHAIDNLPVSQQEAFRNHIFKTNAEGLFHF